VVQVAIALLMLLVASSFAHAEKRIALLIGNKDYKASVGALANPLNDIRVVGDALKVVGFEVLKPAQNARRADMLIATTGPAARMRSASCTTRGTGLLPRGRTT